MRVVRDSAGDILAIELTCVELKELLAFEATWSCLASRDRIGFLEETRRHYAISEADMRPFFEKARLAREDVWRLQILKRSAGGCYGAVHVIGDLRRLEARLGAGALETYVDRNRILPFA